MKQIPILHVWSTDESESKEFLADKNALRVCSTDNSKLEIVIFDESYAEESGSESVHKSINKKRCNWWNRAWGTFGYK